MDSMMALSVCEIARHENRGRCLATDIWRVPAWVVSPGWLLSERPRPGVRGTKWSRCSFSAACLMIPKKMLSRLSASKYQEFVLQCEEQAAESDHPEVEAAFQQSAQTWRKLAISAAARGF